MTGDEKVKKNRDPIFMLCLVIFVVAAVAIIGVYINEHYIEEDNTEAAYGDKVTVNYTGSFYDYVGEENAVVFDTSYSSIADDEKIIKSNDFTKKSSYSGLSFTIGKGEVLAMFGDAVVGHKVGDKFKVEIPVGEGYPGNSFTEKLNAGAVSATESIHKDKFNEMYPDIELKAGMITFTSVYGWEATAMLDKTTNMVQIINNPEVGKEYTYVDPAAADDDDKDKAPSFGTVKFKVTAVDKDILFNYVIDGKKTGGDNGEIQMIKIDLGNGPMYITNVDGDSFTYKDSTETANQTLYFEIELVKIGDDE